MNKKSQENRGEGTWGVGYNTLG
ncbi:unnamed protein product [Spirodela intermedia]|uniref:Uncharacterized protein n=1 Tax=Spirodela intermedia TaxID=51605 RepID=A0A7I8LIM2_SPIIN|nr:unnamed protein product [Spirodela intermedia]